MLTAVERAVRARFGHDPARASVSFVGVQPIEVLRFAPAGDARTYVSLGMSRHPMTASDAPLLATDGPRAELMLELRDPTDAYGAVWRQVAVLAAAPAVEGVVYRPGLTVDLREPLVAGSACTGALVTESPLGSIATPGGEVSVLSVVPATASELAWCRVHGSEALRRRWNQHGTELRDLARPSVRLG